MRSPTSGSVIPTLILGLTLWRMRTVLRRKFASGASRGSALTPGRSVYDSTSAPQLRHNRHRIPADSSVPRRTVRSGRRRHGFRLAERKTAYGAAQESNLPSLGLPDLTGFEDRLGHR